MLDQQLLKKARNEGTRLAEAERQALIARADYHTAVRRLHLGGASLREIAEALDVSHQRVQQIVDAAGGSWWQRVWRSRKTPRDAVCTFCGRPPAEVSKLISGPDVYICDACVEQAERTAAQDTQARAEENRIGVVAQINRRCSFCGKRKLGDRRVIGGKTATICTDCLAVCRGILDDRAE